MSISGGSQVNCLLLNVHAYLGERRNATTARCTTRKNHEIVVSLCPARPPLPSEVFVHCSEVGLTVLPRVVRAAEDLFLLRIAIDCRPDYVSPQDDSDYFIYRAGCGGTKRGSPSLVRLLRPHPSFHDDDVGLLSRGEHYTVAALVALGTPDVYDLHLFHSESEAWIYRKVTLEEPQTSWPVRIPDNCARLLYHDTSTVIAIGGEGGTMGWVDLWRGMLICDVLRDEPTLRGVPLPLPLDLVSCNNGLGAKLGCPKFVRGIAFIKGVNDADDCLKLVHLEANATSIPANDGSPSYIMHSWAIVTWSNTKLTSSWMDWRRDCRVQASNITMDSQIMSQLLQSTLLREPLDDGRGLENLLVSDPTLDMSAAESGVVYLMAREEFLHPKSFVLALDLMNKTLVGAAEFGTEREPCSRALYCPCAISNYICDESGDAQVMPSIRG